MRVLTVGNLYPPAAVGGYERIWMSAVEALRRAGHEARVLTTDAPAPPDDAFRELRWFSLGGHWERPRRREAAAIEHHDVEVLRRHLLEWRPDVVCWWGMGGLPMALLAEPARLGVPAVGIVADGWMVYGPEADPRGRRTDFGGLATWLFISRAVEDRVRQEGHVMPRTAIVHPGVDPERFPHVPAGPWRWRLAVIGRVQEGKGVEVAVAALDHLPQEATLTVDGPGELTVRHPRARRASTPSDRVLDAYAAADAVLFPVTWTEPWGLVPLEAMSVGRPVVATGTGGSAEYLEDGRNALVVPPGDAGALAAAVRRLAADPALREHLVAGGRETAARYSQAAFDSAIVAALEAAAGGAVT